MRQRTRARRLALEALYQVDLLGPAGVEEGLAAPVSEQPEKAGPGGKAEIGAPVPDVRGFAGELVHGVLDRSREIDERIRAVAENWDLARMATIDRNILRLGTYELLYRDDIPPKVSINEAVELAKRYSTAESGTFVNGILDRIKSQVESASQTDAQPGTPTEMEDE